MVDRLDVLGVRVGRPAAIGTAGDHEVRSAIGKDAVAGPTVPLAPGGLAGDEQADPAVHGGPEKAVYCYPSEHVADWVADGFAFGPGTFGENVIVGGGRETDVRVGDVWRWSDALVQISQPRAPCFKFAMHTGRPDAGPHMIATGRCGWYLRVLEPGAVAVDGAMTLVDRDDDLPTVRECFGVMFPGTRAEADDADLVARVLTTGALSPEWARSLARRHER